ncbi:zinc finger protein VAR3, chloroplastic [Malania oleifera]|uniref:zinc finger protein VAR3, chloroplastic n=1 Tax=Malania oleifera TaxID=397392 RepID=UPI0025AE6336|nr:zinc finger protein VAR3, chloroplastic [Malania oleifera]
MLYSATKILLFGTSIFRSHIIVPRPLPKPFPAPCFHFLQCSSSAAVDTASIGCDALEPHHPWTEWVAFVNRLKSKGYFPEASVVSDYEDGDVAGVGGDAASVYKDMNILKDPCLSFARDRYDLFKSLSRKDIQTVVENGCPNLLRKVVNSAKRLRAYVRLDEGDVCGACNLRGACDRAYMILKDSEAAARTVDIVRVLLFYALDPLVISDGERPPGREVVEASVRKLLSGLVELSDTSPDPALPKPASKVSYEKERLVNFVDDEMSQNVEMKRGDWMCPKCNFMNFAKNIRCLKCQEDGPKKVGADDVEMKKGDWICRECSFMNFARNIRCLKCKAEGPKRVNSDDIEMKKGDWNCTQCGFMNFASNRTCLRCRELRPKRQLNPGEWECPSCDFLNYRRNMACLKCNCKRPEETER